MSRKKKKNRSVLLLNTDFTVLGRIDINKAVVLLFTGKVVPFEVIPDEWLHGPADMDGKRFSMQVPISVYLKTYRYIAFEDIAPMDETMAGRMAILHRDNFQCAYCLGPASTIDHVVPQAKGGQDTFLNLVACCLYHNQLKKDMDLEEFLEKYGLKMLREPFIPDSNKYAREQKRIWDLLESGKIDIPEMID